MKHQQNSKTILVQKVQQKISFKKVKPKSKKKTDFQEVFLKYVNILIPLLQLIDCFNF